MWGSTAVGNKLFILIYFETQASVLGFWLLPLLTKVRPIWFWLQVPAIIGVNAHPIQCPR